MNLTTSDLDSRISKAKEETTMIKKKSPADICLRKVSARIDIPNEECFKFEDTTEVPIEIEIRAWVCPFCEQSTEYILVNGHVLHGCGMSTLMMNGKSSDCCGRDSCKLKQAEWHKEETK